MEAKVLTCLISSLQPISFRVTVINIVKREAEDEILTTPGYFRDIFSLKILCKK